MGGFLGIGGASWKTDRSNFLGALKNMGNIFNFALPQGKEAYATGQQQLGQAGDYYSKLLSGNRATALQAVAPETAAVTERADASRRQLATSGTARGGGVASTNQTAKDKSMAQIDQLLFGVRPGAAKGLESIGGKELSTASNMLGLGADIESGIADMSMKSRMDSYKINQDMVGKASQAIINVLSGFF